MDNEEEEMTINEAVEIAKHHLVSVLPEYGTGTVQLEELEAPPFGSKWSFTFSATLPVKTDIASSLAEIMRGRRVSKSVQIDPGDGALLSIKNAAV